MSVNLAERPAATEFAPYYAGYVASVPEGDLLETMERQLGELHALPDLFPEERGDHAYAPGKWTVKEVLGHCADTERIFAYRLLRVARGDRTPLPGFDQDEYVPSAGSAARSVRSLVDELVAVRHATLALARGLPAEAWGNTGVASGFDVSARALGYITAGHLAHHLTVLRERYL